MRLGHVIAVTAFGLAIVACGRASDQPVETGVGAAPTPRANTPPQVAGAGVSIDPETISPLSDLTGSGGDTAVGQYNNLTQAAIAKCMNSRGLHYEAPPKFVAPVPSPTSATGATAYAQQYGYGLLHVSSSDASRAERAAMDRNGDFMRSLAPAALESYVSGLTDCRGQVDQVASKYFPFVNSDVTRAIVAEQGTVQRDQRVVDATKAWSACMSGKGINAATVSDARNPISDAVAAKRLSADVATQEIQSATASAECSQGTIWPATRTVELEAVDRLAAKFGREALCGRPCMPVAP